MEGFLFGTNKGIFKKNTDLMDFQKLKISPLVMSINEGQRIRRVLADYCRSRQDGKSSGYKIRQVKNDTETSEHFYVLLQIQNLAYKGQSHILEVKTRYGDDSHAYKYPVDMPKVMFVSKIFHVNVNPSGGTICVDILKDSSAWVPSNTISSVMQSILVLLQEPNNNSAWNGDASRMWQDCEKKAKELIGQLPKVNGKVSLRDEEKVQQEAFATFASYSTEQYLKSTPFKEYAKYFPELLDYPISKAKGKELEELEMLKIKYMEEEAADEIEFQKLCEQILPKKPVETKNEDNAKKAAAKYAKFSSVKKA